MMIKIPASHIDLIEGPVSVALSTIMPDGQPQTTVVWCNYDGTHILINSMSKFQKTKNMRRDPKVTILAFKRSAPLRFIEVRGRVVEMTEEGALAHLDELAILYTGKAPYFGEVIPEEWRNRETPVLCKVAPVRINTLP